MKGCWADYVPQLTEWTRVNLDPGCRVVRWLESLTRLAATDRRAVLEQMLPSLQRRSWDHPFKDSFRDVVDSRMFVEIVEQLWPDLSELDLRDLVSGITIQPFDQSSSRARDREFELAQPPKSI